MSVENFGEFSVISRIGQGSFGVIFSVCSEADGNKYAMKAEPISARLKTVQFESKVLSTLQGSKYVPRFVASGQTRQFNYLAMELLGPSLSSVLRKLNQQKFSVPTGIRIAKHLLLALEDIHSAGFIHRDIKPGNILIRNSLTHPIALIDFGMARIYIDHRTGRHLPARSHPGFRGTAAYASAQAHMCMDLSRRDDMVSWFYVVTDLLTFALPWRKVETRAEILRLKRNFDVSCFLVSIAPEFGEIWRYIERMNYEDRPEYERIYSLLNAAMSRLGIKDEDPYDWNDISWMKDAKIEEDSVKDNDETERTETSDQKERDQIKPTVETPILGGDEVHQPRGKEGCAGCCEVA